jgi:hypothetical protein
MSKMEDTPETPLISSGKIIFTDLKKTSRAISSYEGGENDQDDNY